MRSHAANPLAIPLEGNIFRVLYNGRDEQNRSSISFVDIDIITRKIVYSHPEPIFEHGGDGSFYSHGVSLGNSYVCNEDHFILFMGWKNCSGEHWQGVIGRLAILDNMCLTLTQDYPFLDLDEKDPVSLSYPWILSDHTAFEMWYGSTLSWDAGNGEMIHIIKYATSNDGVDWQRHGQAIPHKMGLAQAFSRPSVVKDHNGYHMWFSYRGGTGVKYRIGYAHSSDGYSWESKLRQSGIDVSNSGWDSEMIEYPFVFDHMRQRYMLYNGNDYGRTGFGLAVLEWD